MMNWIREHIHTIAVLLAVALVVLAGIVLGGIFAFLSGFWLVSLWQHGRHGFNCLGVSGGSFFDFHQRRAATPASD
jgi:hypothetical protein